jgi:hypothetical protein
MRSASCIPALMLALLASGHTWAATPQVQTVGSIEYLCGGVSDEEMSAVNSQRGNANTALLFTAGAHGEYLADVGVTIRAANRKADPAVVTFTSQGPLCLLKLPAGKYRVEASHHGSTISRDLTIDSSLKQTTFNWPKAPDPLSKP